MLDISPDVIPPQPVRLADYRPSTFLIDMVDLVFDGLARARQAGVTLIMIEQYVHRALAFADQCMVLQRGGLAWSGPASAAHTEVLRHYLGDALTAAG